MVSIHTTKYFCIKCSLIIELIRLLERIVHGVSNSKVPFGLWHSGLQFTIYTHTHTQFPRTVAGGAEKKGLVLACRVSRHAFHVKDDG